MTDAPNAHIHRVAALFDALNKLGPQDITELDAGILDLMDDDVIVALELATDRLLSAAYVVLADGLVDAVLPQHLRQLSRSWTLTRMPRLVMKATRWTQTLAHALGGIVVTDTLSDAVTAAVTYQLAVQDTTRTSVGRPYVSLDGVAADVLTKANSTPA